VPIRGVEGATQAISTLTLSSVYVRALKIRDALPQHRASVVAGRADGEALKYLDMQVDLSAELE